MEKSPFTEKHQRFRLLLVQARKRRKFTQSQLAKKLHRPQSFVSKYERGERRLDVVEFLDVARALGIAPRELLEELEPG